MDTGLAGKTALITAGATGIGFGIARALAAEGVNLAIASLDLEPGNIDELRRTGVRVEAFHCDLSQEEQTVGVVQKTIAAFGQLDLYVNNAAWAWHQPVTRLDTDSLLKTLRTNLFACVWACREVAKHMIERRSGSILITGSTAMLNPFYQESAYRISKAGLPILCGGSGHRTGALRHPCKYHHSRFLPHQAHVLVDDGRWVKEDP